VKGKTVGLEIHTVLDLNAAEHADDKQTHDAMHVDYRNQKFDAAIQKCKQLQDRFDGQMKKYYDMWQERFINITNGVTQRRWIMLANPDLGVYEIFLEDSTRTSESFKNAAKFHRVKLNTLNADHSSFNNSITLSVTASIS
jgi:glucan phosphorylase